MNATMTNDKQNFKTLSLILISLVLFGCGGSEQKEKSHSPIIFESGDECHVCGMLITRIPGPKGQAFDKRSERIKKFCSTFDLISWYLQPENKSNVTEIYVHDMANTNWETPDDAKLISARNAFFVIDSKKKSSMGKSIVGFEKQEDAELFIGTWGGNIKRFDQLTVELVLY